MAKRKAREEICPTDLTFEKGTLGRIVLIRGLKLEWGNFGAGPVAVLRDHWKRIFVTDIPEPDGPRPSLTDIMKLLGQAALAYQRSRMDPKLYAEQVGVHLYNPLIDKEFEELGTKMWHLRNFL